MEGEKGEAVNGNDRSDVGWPGQSGDGYPDQIAHFCPLSGRSLASFLSSVHQHLFSVRHPGWSLPSHPRKRKMKVFLLLQVAKMKKDSVNTLPFFFYSDVLVLRGCHGGIAYRVYGESEHLVGLFTRCFPIESFPDNPIECDRFSLLLGDLHV